MTESEWLNGTDPDVLIDFIQNATTTIRTRWQGWRSARRFVISERKWQLLYLSCILRAFPNQEDFALAIYRQIEGVLQVDPSLEDAPLALSFLSRILRVTPMPIRILPLLAERRAGMVTAQIPQNQRTEARRRQLALERAWQADVVRDVLGNPFRCEPFDPIWLEFNDGAAGQILRDISDSSNFADLPILADALEDAGCTSTGLLEHLRHPGPHVRGCWAIDLLLGKS
jgi:hypothetical protein